MNKVNILSSLRQFEEAINCYDRAIELNSNKGNVLAELRQNTDTITYYIKTTESE